MFLFETICCYQDECALAKKASFSEKKAVSTEGYFVKKSQALFISEESICMDLYIRKQ